MSDDAVSKRLDRAWFGGRGSDGVLDTLRRISAAGVPVGVALLVDGRVVRGTITHRRALSDAATDAIRTPVERYGGDWDSQTRRSVLGIFDRDADDFDRMHTDDRNVLEKYADPEQFSSIDDVDRADVPAISRTDAEPAYVVVRGASMAMDGQEVHIGVLSVNTAAISAWWFIDQESGVELNYQ